MSDEWIPGQPWLPHLATEYIRELIRPKTVFEWGSGGSTIFFADLGAHVVSVESNPEWYARLGDELKYRRNCIDRHLIPWQDGEIGPDKADPAHYKSGSTELGPVNFLNYASFIDACDPLDLILVDGYARASCLTHAAPKVKSGGWLVLDNTDRDYYLARTLHLFAGWERIDFYGYGPILAYPWKTTFFRRRP